MAETVNGIKLGMQPQQPKMVEIKSEHGTFKVEESLFSDFKPYIDRDISHSKAALTGNTLTLKNGISIILKDKFQEEFRIDNGKAPDCDTKDGDAVVTVKSTKYGIGIYANDAHWVDIEARNSKDDEICVSIQGDASIFKDQKDKIDVLSGRVVIE